MAKRIEISQQSSELFGAMRSISFCLWFCLIPSSAGAQLRPVVEPERDTEIVLKIISKLDQKFKIYNFITFLGDHQFVEGGASLPRSLMETFHRPVIVVGSSIGKLKAIINHKNVAVIYLNSIHDPTLRVLLHSLEDLKMMWCIFVYKPNEYSSGISIFVRTLFKWCIKYQFHNVLVVLESDKNYDIWTYKFDSTLSVFNYSENSIENAISLKLCAVNAGVRPKSFVSVHESVPDAFAYNSSNVLRLGGATGFLLDAFMKSYNGYIQVFNFSHVEYEKMLNVKFMNNRDIDVGANLMLKTSQHPSSPIWMSSKGCMVFPRKVYLAMERYGNVFDRRQTILAFVLIFTLLNAVIKRIVNRRSTFIDCLFSSVRLSLGQPIASRAFRRLGLPEKLIEAFTQIFNLIFLSVLIGIMTMALNTDKQKLNGLNIEAISAGVTRIMIFPLQNPNYDVANRIPPSIRNHFVIFSKAERDRHIYALNDSYAYVLEAHEWRTMDYLQRRLREPKFIRPSPLLCSETQFLQFYIRQSAFCSSSLKRYVITAREMGLTEKWLELGLRQSQDIGLITPAPYDPLHPKPLPLSYFDNAFLLYGVGIMLSLIAVMLECLYALWRSRNILNTT